MSTSIEFLTNLINQGVAYDKVEAFVGVFSPQLREDAGFLAIPVKSLATLERWAPSNSCWVGLKEEKNLFVILLVVQADEKRPVARCYYVEVSRVDMVSFSLRHPSIQLLDSADSFDQVIDKSAARERIRTYHDTNNTPLSRALNAFATGRRKNTATKDLHFLDSGEHCLMCEERASILKLATVGSGEEVSTLMALLCQSHVMSSGERPLVEYLAHWCGNNLPIKIRPSTADDMMDWATEAIKQLDCTVEKVNPKKLEVTGIRPSGFKVILRCEAATAKGSYGYMVLDPSGQVNVKRIDNAQDHPEQPFRWDHRHLGLPEDNSEVEPSFTTGMPLFDLPAILSELLRAEAQS